MQVEFACPRPEYPRPDRQRGTREGVDWLNLNGPWQFRFDRYRVGIDENWFIPDEQEWREQIIVPFCWESLAAWGEGGAAGNENYYSTRVFYNPLEITKANHRAAARYEVGWYRRTIEIPDNPAWQGKRVILTIGAADFFTDCWCNGQHLGHHEGGYTPFEYDLTDTLGDPEPDGKRRAHVVLRVEDPVDNNEQPVGKQWRWYTTTSGIWQTVFLEPRSATYIRNFKIYTDIDAGTARFQINCEKPGQNCEVAVEIFPPNGEPSSTFKLDISDGVAEQAIKVNPLLLWNPNEPHLYKTILRLQNNGQTEDSVRTYFGMRKIDFAPGDPPDKPVALRLNGVARYLRGALHQSYYPEGVYTAGDVQTFINDIGYAKRVGFNFLRIHIKIDDPLLLYHADKMGMLLMADFPNFGEGGDTPLGRKRFEVMMREAIDRDFNHPSIFAWCTFNETWGFGGQVEFVDMIHPVNPKDRPKNKPLSSAVSAQGISAGASTAVLDAPKKEKEKLKNLSSHAWVQSMWELAKKLDPTRLIEDMSVVHWEHLDYFAHGDTDINSWHFYINDYYRAKEHIAKVVNQTFPGSNFNYVPGFAHKGQPLINSEYGGVGALDGDVDISWTFKFLTNELRRHGAISAYIFTELHDVEWEHNGFLNYDRTPKEFGYDPRIINESDTLPMDAPPISRVAPGQVLKVDIASSHFSSRPNRNISLRWRLDGLDTRGRIHQSISRGCVPIDFPHRRVAHALTVEVTMPEESMLCTLSVDACNLEGKIIARNFVQYFVSDHYPLIREATPRSLILRGNPGDWAAAEWSGGMGERDQERAEDCCYGTGHGFFEWVLPLNGADLSKARRLRILCEISSHRIDTPQTDDDIFPTTLHGYLNGIQIYNSIIRNHPHDSRGVLSYLRGGKGAYGYLEHGFAEGETLQQIARHVLDDHLHLRLVVPADALAQGGLTVYGAECGGYPISPTIIIEW
ncbi:glycoside hydrolase family 2 protein [Pedosphaera parvula]|uniref:Beta-galactosidase n=1 Tax=Pedosphaera parvula (strain Ellin514) TaxID=320771 RepID=B9XEJ4_PEDPL|nr:sugar-binding domain-containing protein [Pedosphaera parvula]EEF61708.1 Beta-galactosidase [Pedosphaera parvula Ellin514]